MCGGGGERGGISTRNRAGYRPKILVIEMHGVKSGIINWWKNTHNFILGVTIAAKIDYCDSIDIAESAIAILLLLGTTIAILLQYYCQKQICLLLGCNKEQNS